MKCKDSMRSDSSTPWPVLNSSRGCLSSRRVPLNPPRWNKWKGMMLKSHSLNWECVCRVFEKTLGWMGPDLKAVAELDVHFIELCTWWL